MTVELVDYSYSRPSLSGLKSAGRKGVVRYMPYKYDTGQRNTDGSIKWVTDNGKGLTASEVAAIKASGLTLTLNFEWFEGRMKQGAAAGKIDAQTCVADFAKLGLPSKNVVYFSADWNTTPDDYHAIDAYLKAAAAVLGGVQYVGIYGEEDLIAHCRAAGTARWFWQTYAWSGGQLASPAPHIYQYNNGETLAGGTVDYDRAYYANYGQVVWAAQEEPAVAGPDIVWSVTSDADAYAGDLVTASIVGDGHYAIRAFDGKGTPIVNGKALGVCQVGTCRTAYGSSFSAGEKVVGYMLDGVGYCISPFRDLGSTVRKVENPLSAQVKTLSDQVAALDAKVSDLTAKLDQATAAAEAGVELSTAMRKFLGL